MTDTDIIKAKKIIHSLHAYCFLTQPTYKQMGCDFCENDFDILNKFIDDNNRQKAENEKKDIEIDILIRKKETLRDEISELRAEIERLEQILDKRCDVCPAVTSAIKEYSKYLVDKSIKGFLRADDIVDCCYDFTHQPTKIEHNSLCETETYERR